MINFPKKASNNLHNTMIKKLTKAEMIFYDNYFIGNILKRVKSAYNEPVYSEFLVSILVSIFRISIYIMHEKSFIRPMQIFIGYNDPVIMNCRIKRTKFECFVPVYNELNTLCARCHFLFYLFPPRR